MVWKRKNQRNNEGEKIESENQSAKKVKVEKNTDQLAYNQKHYPPPCKQGPGPSCQKSGRYRGRYSLLKLLHCDILIEIALPNRIYVKKLQKFTTIVRRR